jgi:hypothetical protein
MRPSSLGVLRDGEQLKVAFDALEPMPSAGLEGQILSTLGEVAGDRGHEYLARSRRGDDTRGYVDRDAPSLPVRQDHLAGVDPCPNGDPDRRESRDQRECAVDRSLRAVEDDEERIPGRSHLLAAEAHQDVADDVIVHVDGAPPGRIAVALSAARGVDDIGEEHRSDDSKIAAAWRHAEAGTARPIDHHEFIVALDPDDVTRFNVNDVIRPDDLLLAGVGADAQAPAQDDAAMVLVA